MKVIHKDKPTMEDYVTVAKVLHGHLWIKLAKVNRLGLIRNIYTKNIIKIWPSMPDFLRNLFDFAK